MVVSYNLWPVGRRWTTWSEHFHCRRKMPSKVPTLSTWLLKCIQPKSRNCQTKTKPKKKAEIIITTMTMLLKTKQLLLAKWWHAVEGDYRAFWPLLPAARGYEGRESERGQRDSQPPTFLSLHFLVGGSLFFVGALRRWLPCEK